VANIEKNVLDFPHPFMKTTNSKFPQIFSLGKIKNHRKMFEKKTRNIELSKKTVHPDLDNKIWD
jgi:hypothetical protein